MKLVGIEFSSAEEILAMLVGKNLQSASPYRRIPAFVIDMAICYMTSYHVVMRTSFGRLAFEELTGENLIGATFPFCFLVILPFYYAISFSIPQRTVGSWLSGISIIRLNGRRPGFVTGLMRGATMGMMTGIFFPIFPTMFIIYITIGLLTYKKDALQLHGWDMVSQTIVVQKGKKV